ncbi:DUF3732 domain-containing protein [Listeria booriae]|uniref:DUF3732 domain-containing protein n=1 Tax=Listeria booriae TaxID=1552123 RepID=UPI0016262862
MRFYIENLLLWRTNGKLRKIKFLPNKVNVITGESGTGKSEIIDIIDYCFFASDKRLTEEIINENVSWYGIKFHINEQVYTIARGSIVEGKVSNDYYFSPSGEVPSIVRKNMPENQVKQIIDKEFNISDKTIIPYGGKKIKLGSKISLRYFFMFNTQSGDVIDKSDTFFDKQSDAKYREALDRIFDLAIGIETEENIVKKERLIKLEQKKARQDKRNELLKKEADRFREELVKLGQRASSLGLLGPTESEDIYDSLRMISTKNIEISEEDFTMNKLNKLTNKKNEKLRLIRKLNRYNRDYKQLMDSEKRSEDSLKMVDTFQEQYAKVLEIPDISFLISILKDEYNFIREEMKNKHPFHFDVNKRITLLKDDVRGLEKEINHFTNIGKEKDNSLYYQLLFIGELRVKLDIIENEYKNEDKEESTERVESLIKELSDTLIDYSTEKQNTLDLLDELIQFYLDEIGSDLGNYNGYKSAFNYSKKVLELRKPKSTMTSKVGSSSNHMFLHLALFLGLQELLIRNESKYVPFWLILDQPSRPYFADERDGEQKDWKKVNNSDRAKITKAMKLLNDFINMTKNDLEKDFQIIVFEHIPKSIWEEAKLVNFHLVEEFRNGNALM